MSHLKIHYKTGENLAGTVVKLVEKFELLGQVSNVKNKTRAHRSRTAENITSVAESVEENPGLSIRFLESGISQTLLHRIWQKDSGLNPFEVGLFSEVVPHIRGFSEPSSSFEYPRFLAVAVFGD